MCTVAAAVALTVASTAASAYGSYQETKAANKAAAYNAQILEQNAAVSDVQAADATERGGIAERQKRLQVRGLTGQQRSTSAASGVLVDSGSALEVLEDTAVLGEMDALTIRYNAEQEAFGFKSQARDFRSQARLSRMGIRSPGAGVVPSLLTGASSFTNIYAFSR